MVLANVSYARGRHRILDGIDLSVSPGSSVAIMGESGSGKSTLLHVMAGLFEPCSGQVLVDGLDLARLSRRERDRWRRKYAGFVYQFGELIPELTLAENVELPLLLSGANREMARGSALSALSRVGIEQLAGRRLWEVSGGQQQRAALARGLVHEPRFLFADEPTGALDDVTTDQVMGDIMDTVGSTTVILATHSKDVASRCERVIYIRGGSLTSLTA